MEMNIDCSTRRYNIPQEHIFGLNKCMAGIFSIGQMYLAVKKNDRKYISSPQSAQSHFDFHVIYDNQNFEVLNDFVCLGTT